MSDNSASPWSDGTDFKGDFDNTEQSSSQEMYQLPSGNFDMSSVAPIFGMNSSGLGLASGAPTAADYLDYDIKGRGFFQKCSYNSGTAYFGGILSGGCFGFFQGLKNSPSPKFKIRLNSVLNSCGKNGAKTGNALATLAIMYTSFEGIADYVELDRYVPLDQMIPISAATATGMLYKSTAGPRPMIVAGILGGGLMTMAQMGMGVLDITN